MNYYERHLGDYAKDTGHLTMLEHGAYTLLLDRYYGTEQGIQADQAHRIARARTREEKAAVDAVLSEFFTLTEGIWTKGRVEEEIAKAQGRIGSARSNGKKGGRPRKNPDETQEKPSGFSLGSENETGSKALHTPDTKHQLTPNPFPGFDEFWSAWPKSSRKGGKADCEKVWKSRKLESVKTEILAHVRAMAASNDWTKQGGEFIPAPVVYLRGAKWDGAEIGGEQSYGLQLVGAI